MSRKQQKRAAKRKKSVAAARRRRQSSSARQHFRPHPEPTAQAVATGAAYLASGQLGRSRECFERVLQSQPQHAVALNCLGIVCRLQGDHAKSIELLQTAIDLQPDFAEAHCNLGNAYRDVDLSAEAVISYQRAIELKPGLAEAHNNLGVALLSSEKTVEAIPCFRQALALNPQYVEAYNNLGNALRDSSDLAAACQCYRQALQLLPRAAEVHNNLANALRDSGDLSAARNHYEQALCAQPGLVEASDNLGTVLVDLGEYDGAVEAYERTIRISPSADTYVNLGNAYKQQGRLGESRAAFQRAAELEPANTLHSLRISALCPTVFGNRAELEVYRESVHRSWMAASRQRSHLNGSLLAARLAEPPFELQFLDGNLRQLKELYASIFAGCFPHEPAGRRTGKPRIGFVVTSTHEGIFLRSMRGVLERLRSDLAELVVICPPASIAAIQAGVEREIGFLPLPHSFPQMVQRIQAASFDLLHYWEIGTDVTNYFLPFLRLAPVQCTSWGVQVTSGIGNVDYYLSSDLVEADDAQEHYSERLLRAKTLLTYQFRDRDPAVPEGRSSFRISAEQHVYLCGQQLGKFHPDFDDTIGDLLRRDPRGLFVAIRDRHGTASQLLQERWRQTIPDVVDRVRLLPRQDRTGYVSLILAADVLLDPPHFGGVNSTYDALGFGKLVVTSPSQFHRGRYTLGCYRKLGIGDCVADGPQQYVDCAVELACNRRKREQLESRLRAASGTLFEDRLAIDEHERLFAELIEKARATD